MLSFFLVESFSKVTVAAMLSSHFKRGVFVCCYFSGTLWNLSSHDSVKMEIVDHAIHALSDEVMVPHSGWEQGSNGAGGGEENCKPRHLEWEMALTNTAGCLRYGDGEDGGVEGWCQMLRRWRRVDEGREVK